MKTILIPLGPPGVGKGTVSGYLKERFGISHTSTGEIIRRIEKQDSNLGRLVLSYNSKGLLTPDDIMIQIIEDRVSCSDCRNGYIIDGFPRTVPQAEFLDQLLQRQGETFTAIYYYAPEEVVRQRIQHRVETAIAAGLKPRNDDVDPVRIQTRLSEFYTKGIPVVEYYRKKGMLIEIDARPSPEAVFEETLTALL